jgi:glycosyltransferase involved in cell wall biosynthesis
MKKVIAVNTRILVSNKLEGIGNFTTEIFKRLVEWNPDYEFHFIFNYPYDEAFIFGDNVIPHIIQPPARHPILVKIWYDFSLKRKLKQINPDIFISPDAITSLTTAVKTITVIHDLGFVHRPNDLPKSWRKFYNKYSPKFAEKSERIATVSQYSKQDLINSYNVPEEKIDVVYNGVKSNFKPLDPLVTKELTDKKTQGNPYFFYIGSLHPRKNILNLLKGFDSFKIKDKKNTKLVIGGDFLFKSTEIEKALATLKFKEDIILTGRLSDNDLNKWLSGATALTYIPYFEGFGIPVLEAMSCNTVVITSNVTSLPEIAGDAAHFVSPDSITEIAEGMRKVSESSDYQNELIKKGQQQLKEFSWDKSANLLWESIQKVLAS